MRRGRNPQNGHQALSNDANAVGALIRSVNKGAGAVSKSCRSALIAWRDQSRRSGPDRYTGSTTSARRPPPARFASVTSPPCARNMLRAIGRPRPVPPVSRFRLSSTR